MSSYKRTTGTFVDIYDIEFRAGSKRGRIRSFDTIEADLSVDSGEKVYDLMKNNYFRADRRKDEFVWLLCLNSRLELVGIFELSRGDNGTAIVSIPGIFERLLLAGGRGFILVHNHPSGDVSPSKNDEETTEQLIKASDIMGIRFYDSIIVTDGAYYSFREEGVQIK